MNSDASCIFCKIIKGDIPSFKLYESDTTFAFLDINPLSRGHALIIPKYHGAKLLDIPDEHLNEILPVAKKLAKATGATDYNILQNNGRPAHQVVDHVHFHMVSAPTYLPKPQLKFHPWMQTTLTDTQIPKPNETEGLGVGWPQQKTDMDALKALHEELKSKM